MNLTRSIRVQGAEPQIAVQGTSAAIALQTTNGAWSLGADTASFRISQEGRPIVRVFSGGDVFLSRLTVDGRPLSKRLPSVDTRVDTYEIQIPDDSFSEVSVAGFMLSENTLMAFFPTARVETSVQHMFPSRQERQRNVDRFMMSDAIAQEINWFLKFRTHPLARNHQTFTYELAFCIAMVGHTVVQGSGRSLSGRIGSLRLQLRDNGPFRVTAASLTST